MPQIHPKSEQKHSAPKLRRLPSKTNDTSVAKSPHQVGRLESGAALRRHALSQLTKIQINTAGLSGPYRSDEETMEMVRANHAAVRQVRIVLRRAIVVARRSPLSDALISRALKINDGKLAQAARCLGMTTQQLRRALDADGDAGGCKQS